MEARLTLHQEDSAWHAYQAMAPTYDDFTAGHDSAGWIANLLRILDERGLRGKRLLDVACGTGESFLPMLCGGWSVTGCDLSPAMLARAEDKAGAAVELVVADMRSLPRLGEFDLVWALDDAINYLLSEHELAAALRGMRANLASDGLLLFDLNELMVYETFFAETSIVERDGQRLVWRGLSSGSPSPGAVFEARFEVQSTTPGRDGKRPAEAEPVHRQRHFPESVVRNILNQVGLECLGVFGHGLDGIPRQPLDPSSHTKAIYVARRA